MADEKAIGRADAIEDNSNISKFSASSQPDLDAQGESLFLPYLVEHLRSSLQQQHTQQQPIPPARRRRQAPQPAIHHAESVRVEDSGTESGEDLRFLAAGLRDSIELHRKGTFKEQDTNQGILSEVQSALSRLQSSLQQGCIGTEQVDSSKQNSLLQLIERLQSSLQLPSAGTSWQKEGKPVDLPRGSGSQRFPGRRNKKAHRYTVGVTREELAGVRRFLEESEMRDEINISSEAKPPDVPPIPTVSFAYELVKQCSAGDVPTVGSQGSAFRPFRPTHFLPKQFDGLALNPQVEEGRKALQNVPRKPTPSEIKNPTSDAQSDDDEDDDTDFVEEKAIMGKAFKSANNNDTSSADSDPSCNLFKTSQSVQIAVHKDAINRQLSIEDKRKESKDIEPETSDEDTMTDASCGSETEKAESDGYEEEDKEFEEDEVLDRKNVRSNTKHTSDQVGIVRNSTYTIQPRSANPPKMLQEKERIEQTQGQTQKQDKRKEVSHSDKHIQSKSKLGYYNEKKSVQREPEVHMMHNKAYISSQQSGAPRHEDNSITHHVQKRNPPPYVHHDVNHKYVEAKQTRQADQWNGKGASTAKEVTRSQVNDGYVQVNVRQVQDKNKNQPSETSGHNGAVSEGAHYEQNPASNDSTKAARFANRQLKKQKMKRANTIDIPKPLHYYDVDDESESSSDVDSQKEVPIETRDDHKIDKKNSYKSTSNTAENVQRSCEERANDRAGPNSHKIERKVKQMFEDVADTENPSYNPQAHGGAQWNSRFANIKTCFETPGPKELMNLNKKQSDGLNRARSFWRSADDSTLKVSKNSAFHDPKLTKQGSQFLKKLHEQKDQGQTLQKLPWTATEHENVVVGSLVVPANITKPAQSAQHQGPVNKFSHAPLSAFRPIEKKNISTTKHTPWAAPSVTGSVKQIASSKFSLPDPQPPATVYKQEPPKTSVKASANLQALPSAPTPVSPTLPWTKDVSHTHNLNSTLAKFESMSSRESSPQLMPNALLRSQSQDRVPLISNFSAFGKNVPVPPPRTYIPVPQTNIAQTRTQNLATTHRQELPFIPEQHPHPLLHSKSNQYIPQGNYYSAPIKNHPLFEGDNNFSDSEDEEPEPSSSHLVLSTLQGNTEQQTLRTDKAPVQTYSAGVTARQSIYGVVQQTFLANNAPMPEDSVDHGTYYKPEPTHVDFAEEHTAAVTRVMGRPQCQAAVTVTHKTRHCNEEEEGERGSAAFHLASLIHKFSADDVAPTNKVPAPKDVPPKPKQIAGNPEKWTFISVACAQTNSLPPKPEGSPRAAREADVGYNRTIEQRSRPLPLYSDPDRIKTLQRPLDRQSRSPPMSEESPDFVYASHFEIPVNKVQNITMKFQSLGESLSEPIEERKPAASPNPGVVLRKSESWHQLAAQQQGLTRRPQSMVVPDLPPVKPRSPNPLPKAKSSHSLAFPKQFEAAIKPESLEKKQKTVEEFFKKGKTEVKTNSKSSVYKHMKIAHSAKSYSGESAGVMLLDDNIENVDAAFESLFNATSSDSKTKFTRQNSKGSASRIAHR